VFGKDGPHILQRSRTPAGELDRECLAVSTYIGLADHRLDCHGVAVSGDGAVLDEMCADLVEHSAGIGGDRDAGYCKSFSHHC
jgi:hypothetical protein